MDIEAAIVTVLSLILFAFYIKLLRWAVGKEGANPE